MSIIQRGELMSKNGNEPIGVVMLMRHTPEFRNLSKEELSKSDEEIVGLMKKWHSKEGARLLGFYGPVFGTEYSIMEFWEFPDLDSVIKFRREFLDLKGRHVFLKFLIGKSRLKELEIETR